MVVDYSLVDHMEAVHIEDFDHMGVIFVLYISINIYKIKNLK